MPDVKRLIQKMQADASCLTEKQLDVVSAKVKEILVEENNVHNVAPPLCI